MLDPFTIFCPHHMTWTNLFWLSFFIADTLISHLSSPKRISWNFFEWVLLTILQNYRYCILFKVNSERSYSYYQSSDFIFLYYSSLVFLTCCLMLYVQHAIFSSGFSKLYSFYECYMSLILLLYLNSFHSRRLCYLHLRSQHLNFHLMGLLELGFWSSFSTQDLIWWEISSLFH